MNRRIAWIAATAALTILPVAFLGFGVSRLHVPGTQGTVGIVQNTDAQPESWQIVPAADVDVLIVWRAKDIGAKFNFTRCVRAVLMRTNANGEYSIGSWWLGLSWPQRADARGDVYVFNPGHVPIVDRSRLSPGLPYTHILGPPAVNPWTGLVLPDENPLQPTHDRDCPPVERL